MSKRENHQQSTFLESVSDDKNSVTVAKLATDGHGPAVSPCLVFKFQIQNV